MTTPILQALLVADHIYQDVTTGKMVICGVFHRLNVRKHSISKTDIKQNNDGTKQILIPINNLKFAGSPYCYLNLTEVMGTKHLELRFVDLVTNEVVYGTDFEVSCKDPLQVIEGIIPLPVLQPKKAGIWSLELLCESELLGSHRINVVVHEPEEESENLEE